jgi:beta-N-acetylhexosaminidase
MKKAFTFLVLASLGSLILSARAAREDQAIDDQSLRRTVGQLIVVGFGGTNAKAPGFLAVMDDLERGLIGGVLFLPQNIATRADLEAMVRAIRGCACPSVPLVAIDEEGGTVDRLGREFRFPAIPSALEIGRASEADARRQYAALAKKLDDVGFNMNFAPVVDLNRNPRNPVIGAQWRSFSADAAVVEKYARIFIEEHHALGILTSLKHFPGHGSSWADTHIMPTDVRLSWSPEELVPFEHLIGAELVDTIMVGHLSNQTRWGGVATQQGATAISQILRTDLRFDGVVMSDDLAMRAVATGKKSLAQVVRSAIQSGVDLVLVGQPFDPSIPNVGAYANQAIVEGLSSGEIALSAITESSHRVTSLKSKLQAMRALSSLH